MLVLTRKSRETVIIGGSDGFQAILKVTVLDIKGGKVRLGFEAAADVSVPSFGGVGANPRRLRSRQDDVKAGRTCGVKTP